MKKLMITTILSMFASSAVATGYVVDKEKLDEAFKHFDVGLFGQQVAGMALSYVKEVREVDGKKIVDVVIVDKLCHVTVVEQIDGLKAEGFACDEGSYFENRD